ncbi:hypothetical protein [Photobacterium damselae]|uniref:hypothetical protein n=1 Tax=Photobacterium damselae TaxID=38293 RepID=UPI0015936342|nr:hypothetical protein [Photobacterium damselae]NVH46725.1 hypothetical protein [Photobacterium damselae subsp. damselae]
MINPLKSKLIYFSILCSLSFYSSASTLTAKLVGNDLSLYNAQVNGEYISPSDWLITGDLYPTKEWVPGTFLGTSPNQIHLNGPSGDISFSFEVVGVEYRLGAASGYFKKLVSSPKGMKTCALIEQDSSWVKLIGDNCIAAQAYVSDVDYTPFQFARPIIKVDKDELVQAFKDANAEAGFYRGSISINPFFGFKSFQDAWTYKSSFSYPISLQIQYHPAALDSIDISGNGVLEPVYNKGSQTISSQTDYVITAKGAFPSGLNLTFLPNGDGLFDLKYVKSLSGNSIPYSIDCDMCLDNEIVDNGVLITKDTSISESGNEIQFSLHIHYDLIDASKLMSGNYFDSFVIMFEPQL